jgi:glycosyltransferase involved in cell wall biosynthesis
MRIGLGLINTHRAWQKLGSRVAWVYERNAALQSLGHIFKRHNTPWILETNAPLFHEAKYERETLVVSSLARHLEIQAYRACDVLVCVSEALKDIIVQETSAAPEKVVVVPNGVDVEFFDPGRYRPVRLFDDLSVGFVGKLSDSQGIDLLLEALRDLRASGLKLNLVLVGDGPARNSLQETVEGQQLTDQVKFVGRVPRGDVPTYVAGFDVGYSAQIKSSIGVMYRSPLKLYEYMAMAKPVVASDFGDARRLVSKGETGYLFEPDDKDSIKEALVAAYDNHEHLGAMGRLAREEIVNNHSWTRRVSNLINSAERILG